MEKLSASSRRYVQRASRLYVIGITMSENLQARRRRCLIDVKNEIHAIGHSLNWPGGRLCNSSAGNRREDERVHLGEAQAVSRFRIPRMDRHEPRTSY